MKRGVFLLLFFFIASSSLSQSTKFLYGLSASLDHNWYESVESPGPPDFQDFKGATNFSLGLVFKYALSEKLSLATKVLYSTKNYRIHINGGSYSPIEGDDPIIIHPQGLSYSNGFVDVPVEINFRLNQSNATDIYIVTGFVNSFQVSHKSETWYFGSEDEKTYQDYLLSVKFGGGLMFKTKKIGICLEPQIRFYLTKVHEEIHEKPIHVGLELQILKL